MRRCVFQHEDQAPKCAFLFKILMGGFWLYFSTCEGHVYKSLLQEIFMVKKTFENFSHGVFGLVGSDL